MLLGLLFAVLICLAGYCGVRLLGLSKGLNGLALAPATGLGVVAILTTWAARMGVFVPGGAVLLVGVACLGGVFLARERRHIQAALTSEPRSRVTLGLLTAAALVPVVVL